MKTVIFDFDGTLHLGYNIWRTLWQRLGYYTHDASYFKKLFDAFKNGEVNHSEWTQLTCKSFCHKRLSKQLVANTAEGITLLDGAEETFKTLKSKGYRLLIVSGNIEEVIRQVLGDHQKFFDGIYANKFIYDKHQKLKAIQGTQYDYDGKAAFIERYKTCGNSM